MISNLVLNGILIGPLAHAGLALATSLSAYVNVVLLWVFLKKGTIYQGASTIWRPFILRLLLACLGICLWVYFLSEGRLWYEISSLERALKLLGVIVSAMLVYAGILFMTGMRLKDLKGPTHESLEVAL